MKRILVCLFILLGAAAYCNAVALKSEKIAKKYHSRMVITDEEFKQLKGMVGGDDVVGKLHKHIMDVADVSVASKVRYTTLKDENDVYLNGKKTARPLAVRLITCSYAYRMTGKKQYRDKVFQDLNDVCALPDWHPEGFLDLAEIAAAVSISYDWMYDVLPKKMRNMIVLSLKEKALDQSRSKRKRVTWWYDRKGNWNQVCNAGLVCAAAAIYEFYPELAQEVIDDAIRTNTIAVKTIYGPDGAYPEGAVYWGYGTQFQVLMLTVLEDVFNTDCGISSAPGFLRTGEFITSIRGPKNMHFNYADNGLIASYAYPLYYFAYKNNDPSMLYSEMKLLDQKSYTRSGHKGYMILAIKYAMKMNLDSLEGADKKFYSAQGNVPLMICRSGWSDNDHFLGVKGGRGCELHGHMDAGMFVYYADGVRWAMDIRAENYDNVRPAIQARGGKLFDMSQNSFRWSLFRMNCRQHNTLTVNDKNHNVNQKVEMTATENTPERMSGTFNLTPLFDGDLEKAERTASLCDNNYIEIKDVLKAPADRPAHVRWTMVTAAVPELASDGGIILTSGEASKKLTVQGGKVTYKIWSNNLEDYDYLLRENGKPVETPVNSGAEIARICGYEIDIPAGAELSLVTMLK